MSKALRELVCNDTHLLMRIGRMYQHTSTDAGRCSIACSAISTCIVSLLLKPLGLIKLGSVGVVSGQVLQVDGFIVGWSCWQQGGEWYISIAADLGSISPKPAEIPTLLNSSDFCMVYQDI